MRADLSMPSRSRRRLRQSPPSWLPLLLGGLLLGAGACSADDDPGGAGGAGGAGGSGGARSGGTGGGAGAGGKGGAPAGPGGQGGVGAGGSLGSGGGGGGAADAGAGVGGSGGGSGSDASAGSDAAGDGSAVDGAPTGPFALTSTAFNAGGLIIKKYRCQGENVSPPLSWTPGPATTKSYAITMRSAGSPHWALWDIPASVTSLPEKIERLAMPPVPAGGIQCKPNVDGSTWYGYAGACPLGGTNSRPYYFELYALRVEKLPGVTADSAIRAVNAAIVANQVAKVTLIGMAAPSSP